MTSKLLQRDQHIIETAENGEEAVHKMITGINNRSKDLPPYDCKNMFMLYVCVCVCMYLFLYVCLYICKYV